MGVIRGVPFYYFVATASLAVCGLADAQTKPPTVFVDPVTGDAWERPDAEPANAEPEIPGWGGAFETPAPSTIDPKENSVDPKTDAPTAMPVSIDPKVTVPPTTPMPTLPAFPTRTKPPEGWNPADEPGSEVTPTWAPGEGPKTRGPTPFPTKRPTPEPTPSPSASPTKFNSKKQTRAPTSFPTSSPSSSPTPSPTQKQNSAKSNKNTPSPTPKPGPQFFPPSPTVDTDTRIEGEDEEEEEDEDEDKEEDKDAPVEEEVEDAVEEDIVEDFMSMNTTFLNCSEYQETIAVPSLPVMVNYVVNMDYDGNGTATFAAEVIYEGEGWVGFAISPTGGMTDSLAIIGLPDEDTTGKYMLGARNLQFISLVENQTLLESSIEQNETHTILSFVKLLEEEGEPSIDPMGNNSFLVAFGYFNDLAYHEDRASFRLELSPCWPNATDFNMTDFNMTDPDWDGALINDPDSTESGVGVGLGSGANNGEPFDIVIGRNGDGEEGADSSGATSFATTASLVAFFLASAGLAALV